MNGLLQLVNDQNHLIKVKKHRFFFPIKRSNSFLFITYTKKEKVWHQS